MPSVRAYIANPYPVPIRLSQFGIYSESVPPSNAGIGQAPVALT